MTGNDPPSSSSALEQTVPAVTVDDGAKATVGEALVKGSIIGRYTVLERIGSGGMGVVYAAFDPELDRRIALKVLHPGGAGSIGATGGKSRLLREAQAMAKLHHPNVITVHDVGTFGDRVFVAMEFVDGMTLRAWIDQSLRDWVDIVDVFVKAGRGLAAAHAVGLVHRDFKPDNVLVGNDGRVLVMDFGLARQAGPQLQESPSTSARVANVASSSMPADAVLTRTGAVLGTPAYMAPEQHAGGVVGAAADQFSFCVALFEGLYGDRPFSGTNVASLAINVLEGRVRAAPRDSSVPDWLHEVLVRGLAVDPSDRHPSMDALLAELQRDPPKTQRPWVTAAVALGVASAIVGGYVISRPDPTASCLDAAARLPPIWDDGARERVGGAFAARGLEYGQVALASVDELIALHEHDWRDAWVRACEDRRPSPEATARAQRIQLCLDDQRAESTALIDRLAHAEAIDVEHAVRATLALPEPHDCLVEPVSPLALLSRSEATRTTVVAAEVELALGRDREASERLAGLVAPHVAIADPALETAALLVHGRAEAHRGHPAAARTSLRRALLSATRADPLLEVAVWLALLETIAHGSDRSDDGWATSAAAEAALVRAGDPTIARAAWLVAQGQIDLRTARSRDAFDRFDRASRILGEALPADDVRIADANLLAGVALAIGEAPQDAIARIAAAMTTYERVLGPSHPDIARALVELGAAQLASEQAAAAEASFARARLMLDPGDELAVATMPIPGAVLPTFPAGAPPAHADTIVRMLDRTGLAARARNDHAMAARWHARAASLADRMGGGDPARIAYPLVNLGIALTELDRPADALAHLRRATAILRRALPADHPDVADALLALGNALAGVREQAEAASTYQAALDATELRLGADHPRLAYALTGLGRARLALGDATGALDVLERADDLRDDVEEDQLNVAETSLWLARALWASHRDDERALAMTTRALQMLGVANAEDPLEIERVLKSWDSPAIRPASIVLVDAG